MRLNGWYRPIKATLRRGYKGTVFRQYELLVGEQPLSQATPIFFKRSTKIISVPWWFM